METGAIEEEVVMVTGVEEVVEEAGVAEMMVAGVAEMMEVGVVEMTEEEEEEGMEEVVEVGMEETGEDLLGKTIFGNQQQVRNVNEYIVCNSFNTTPQTCSFKRHHVLIKAICLFGR